MGCPKLLYYPEEQTLDLSMKNLRVHRENEALHEKKVLNYYPFGMTMPNRSFSSPNYRYGFNGMERDNEIMGLGSSYDFGARIYNSRVGRFYGRDPLAIKFPHLSPFMYANNNPIFFIDYMGMSGIPPWARGSDNPLGGFYMIYQTLTSKESYENVVEGSKIAMHDLWGVRHEVLDGIGVIPIVGEIADGGNAVLYTFEGDYLNAAFSVISLAPAGGDIAAKGLKYSLKYADNAAGIGKAIARQFTNLEKAKEWIKIAMDKGIVYADEAFKFKPCGCFVAGTLILTKDGNKEIQEIEVGDLVWAYSDSTSDLELKQVEKVFSRKWDEVFDIHVGEEIITSTHEHPFFIGGKWIMVQDLKVGDTLTLYNDNKALIKKIVFRKEKTIVYNFEVRDFHSYYVSDSKVLVHNGNPCELVNYVKGHASKMVNGKKVPIGIATKFRTNLIKPLY